MSCSHLASVDVPPLLAVRVLVALEVDVQFFVVTGVDGERDIHTIAEWEVVERATLRVEEVGDERVAVRSVRTPDACPSCALRHRGSDEVAGSFTENASGGIVRKRKLLEAVLRQGLRCGGLSLRVHDYIMVGADHDGFVTVHYTYQRDLCSDAEWDRYPDARHRYVNGAMSVGEASALDRLVPGWHQSARERAWNQQANGAVAHRSRTGKQPSTTSTDVDERSTGRWLDSQRTYAKTNAPRLTPERRAYLNEVYPDWIGTDPWSDTATACAHFRRERHRHPSKTGSRLFDHTTEEARLASWLMDQRYRSRTGTLSVERIEQLDQTYPDWMDERSLDEKTVGGVYRLLYEFGSSNGRNPEIDADDPSESSLAEWAERYRGRVVDAMHYMTQPEIMSIVGMHARYQGAVST